MTQDELRGLATQAFGERLERLNPGALSDFLTSIQEALPGTQRGGIITVDDAPDSYEQAMREYFAAMLYAPPERAVASLWVTAAEMWVGMAGER